MENQGEDFFEQSKDSILSHNPKNPLEKLKSIILSIDWEITDGCLNDLINETNSLLPRFETDRLTQTLLRMLNSLGRYIQKRKASAHPETIKRVMAVFSSLETMSRLCENDQTTKERILAKEIGAFKKLKQQVESQPKKPTLTPQTSRPIDQEIVDTGINAQSKFEKAVSEVEKRLKFEVDKLKTQLANLQKEFEMLRKR